MLVIGERSSVMCIVGAEEEEEGPNWACKRSSTASMAYGEAVSVLSTDPCSEDRRSTRALSWSTSAARCARVGRLLVAVRRRGGFRCVAAAADVARRFLVVGTAQSSFLRRQYPVRGLRSWELSGQGRMNRGAVTHSPATGEYT